MDLGTTIIGATILALCFLPFVFMSTSRKKKEKQLLQAISDMAKKQQCNIDQHEFCRDLVIGLDEKTNTVFFHQKANNTETAFAIPLAEIQNCKAVITKENSNSKNIAEEAIHKLELLLTPKNKKKELIRLEFYNSEESAQPSGELQLLHKWAKIINGRIQ